MSTDVLILEGSTCNKKFLQMGGTTFSVLTMKAREHRNCGWTGLELRNLNYWENYTIRRNGNDRSEIIYEWSLMNLIVTVVTHDVQMIVALNRDI